MEQKVYNRMNPRPATPEKGGGKCHVDKAGYVSAETRIKNLMQAGIDLRDSRRGSYDSEDGSEPDIDPTRNPGYDLADAHEQGMSVAERLRKKKEEMDAKKAKERSVQKTNEGDNGVEGKESGAGKGGGE